jgi:excisionase family DNA binding protein
LERNNYLHRRKDKMQSEAEMQQFQWLTLSEAATFLRKSRPTVYKMVEDGRLPEPLKKGRLSLFRLTDVQKLKKELEA